MKSSFEKVKEFHAAIREPTTDLTELRITLLVEECNELIDAIVEGNKENILKEACDLVYVTCGAIDTLLPGVDFDEGFDRVHQSNMSKVAGGANYREDGKLLKSESYQPPQLGDLI